MPQGTLELEEIDGEEPDSPFNPEREEPESGREEPEGSDVESQTLARFGAGGQANLSDY